LLLSKIKYYLYVEALIVFLFLVTLDTPEPDFSQMWFICFTHQVDYQSC